MMDLVGLSRPVDAGTTRFVRPLAVRYHGGDSKLYRSRSSLGATLLIIFQVVHGSEARPPSSACGSILAPNAVPRLARPRSLEARMIVGSRTPWSCNRHPGA